MNRFQFVADHRDAFEVKRLCEIVHVARSSFYAWLAAAPVRAVRASADTALAERIRKIHQVDRAQGVPRITAELNDGAPADGRVNHKRVARVMRAHAIAGLRLRRRVRTTIPEPADQTVPELLGRDFTAPAPNQRYVGDITYLPIADGSNLYLLLTWNLMAGWIFTDRHRHHVVRGPVERERGGEVARPGTARTSRRVAGHLDQPGPGAADDRCVCAGAGGVSAGL